MSLAHRVSTAALALTAVACVPFSRARHSAPQRISCAAIQNVDAVLTPGGVTTFGELHGTEQSPAFVGSVLCNASARGLSSTVALEVNHDATPALDRYIHSSGSRRDRDALLANDVWHEVPRDGRSSIAMLALLDTARALVRAGADIHVLAFSWPPSLGGQTRDSLMAVTLAESARAHPERVIIGLTGNYHSRVAVGIPSDSTYRPTTYLVRSFLPERRVLGLNVSYDTGTAWVCLSNEPTCGAHAINGHMTVPLHSIQLDPQRAYDGLYGVGTLRASPPAIP